MWTYNLYSIVMASVYLCSHILCKEFLDLSSQDSKGMGYGMDEGRSFLFFLFTVSSHLSFFR